MKKRTLYDVLGVGEKAPANLIEESYKIVLSQCELRMKDGDADARNDAIVARDAYQTLSDPTRRAKYDAMIAADREVLQYSVHEVGSTHVGGFVSWWQLSKTTYFLVGIFVLLAAFVGHRYFNTSKVDSVKVINETRFIEGVIRNQANAISNQSQIRNRALAVSETAEARHMRELEATTDVVKQALDLQRQHQEAQVQAERDRMQREDANRRQAIIDRQALANQQRIEREQRYYRCMNAAIDEYGYAKAELRCGSLR